MKTDRELLELAAKAVGIEYDVEASKPHSISGAWFGLWLVIRGEPNEFTRRRWNPLTDDGDAFRLAVQLGMTVFCDKYGDTGVTVDIGELRDTVVFEASDGDTYAATRRAIVRAAAEIGETK